MSCVETSRSSRLKLSRWRIVLCAPLLAVILAVAALATEPVEEFVQGLKERGLNELALDYLEQMKTSRLVGDDFRRQIRYHRGVVLVEQSRRSADPATRARLLSEARSELQAFAEANPESVQGAEAQFQLASVLMEQGQQSSDQAARLPEGPAYDAQRAAQRQEARVQLVDARETFERAETIYSAELDKLPPTSGADDRANGANRRQEYRTRVAQLRYLAAQAQFETAQSYSPDADEFRQLNESAAKELSVVYEEFVRNPRTMLVGLYARLYEGRCYQAIGSYQLALGCYEDIRSQSSVLPPVRKLIASAYRCRAECFLAQEKFDEAIEACYACLNDAHSDEERLNEWLAVRFRLAEALQKKSGSLPSSSLDQRKLAAEARDAYRFVSNSPSEFQVAARTAAATMARGNGAEKDQPRSFQAAYDAGKDALAAYNAAKLAIPTAEKNNPTAVPELQAQTNQGKEDARRYFRLATTLVDEDTEETLLTEVRYFLCWLYWESADYYRAAVLGEFLARRYPDHAAASSAAKISMASFERLYNQAATPGGDKADADFEARRMARMAEFITRRWPNTEDADAAFSVLVSYAIRGNRIDEAEKLLTEASAQSRPRLELQLGNAMWGRYLELSQADGAARPDEVTLAAQKQSAVKFLRSGLDGGRAAGEISESAATAALYLVQALLADGKYDEAINLLEDRQIGPLTLVARDHPAAARAAYVVEVYKAALRAYVLVTPPREQKALDMMQSLEASVEAGGGNSRESAEQLTRIYLGLGVALEQQIERLRDGGRDAEADRVVKAFARFLDRIRTRQADANWPARVWLAQTYYNMGAGERSGPGTIPIGPAKGAARDYLVKARDAYQQLLDAAAANPNLPPSATAVLAARMQLGECYRALGQYQEALDTFSAILKDKESSLSVQRAAAYSYQERGQAEDAKWLERAIHGGYKLRSTGQNRIWGWVKISQVAARAAQSDEKYRDAFYEARVNVARCRYLAAMKQSGAARQQDLVKAKQSIQSLTQLYPELGGARWRDEFDALLKQIQAAAGQKPAGLQEFSAGQPSQNNRNDRRG